MSAGDNPSVGLFLFVAVVFVFWLGFTLGVNSEKSDMQRAAVEQGVAEFRATPKGDIEFHWKTPTPVQP